MTKQVPLFLSHVGRANSDEWGNLPNNAAVIDTTHNLEARISSSCGRWGALSIRELDNAPVRGEDVTTYTIRNEGPVDPVNGEAYYCADNLIIHAGRLDVLHKRIAGLPWERNRWGDGPSRPSTTTGRSGPRTVSEDKGIRVFSWLHLDRFNPLTSEPKKWTLPHVARAIINGQFTGLKSDGTYTDDYAFDAAVNFQQRRDRESPRMDWRDHRAPRRLARLQGQPRRALARQLPQLRYQ